MNEIKRRTRFLLLSLLLVTAAQAGEITVFEIQSRPAQDLVPHLSSLLGPDSSVSAYGNRLIVRAPADRLEEARWLITELDRAPRNLLVEVRADRDTSDMNQAAGVRTHDMQANIRFRHYSTQNDDDILQRVRTLDGRPALLRIGQSIPIYQVQQSRDGNVTSERVQIDYKDIHTGIHVLPRTHAEQVTLEVYQQAESPASVATGHFDTQHANTVVSGRLGEWIPIGSIDTSGRSRQRGLGFRASTSADTQRQLSVRVTVLP